MRQGQAPPSLQGDQNVVCSCRAVVPGPAPWQGEARSLHLTLMLKSIKIAVHERHRRGTTKGAGVADGAVSYLTKEQVEAFLTAIPAANHRDRLLFHLIYTYGLRRREAAALRLDHLAEERIWINRVK